MLEVNAHEPSLFDVVDVRGEDRVEGFQEVVANERDHSCSLFGVVGSKGGEVLRRFPCLHRGVRRVGFLHAKDVRVVA